MSQLIEYAPRVHVATSRRYATTTTVVRGTGSSVLLIDPAWDPDELDAIAAQLDGAGMMVAAGLATHVHHDHVLWHPGFGRRAVRWASPETARLATEHRDELVARLGEGWPEHLTSLVGLVTSLEGDRLPWDGPAAELIVHRGHAPGHTAAWFEELGVLVAGDMLSDVELPLPDPDSGGLEAYAEALDRFAGVVARCRLVVPGHGHPGTDAVARLDADRRYVEAVLAGRPIDDSRLGNPGMREAHETNVAMAGHG